MHAAPDTPRTDSAADKAVRDIARVGNVQSVDLDSGRCIVAFDDDLATGPIPWAAARAGAVRIWCPPSAGEQVLVVAPEGDLERAVVMGSLFCDASPAPVSDGRTHIQFPDGAVLSYDPEAGDLVASVINSVSITAPGGVSITGDVSINGAVDIVGDVSVEGEVEATEDVLADGVSLTGHVHMGPGTTAVITGVPKPADPAS